MSLYSVKIDRLPGLENKFNAGENAASSLIIEGLADTVCPDKNQDTANNLFAEGLAYIEKGELPKAIKCFYTALEHDSKNGRAHHCLAQCLFWSGDRKQAVIHYRMAANILGVADAAISLCQLAELHALDGQLSQAWIALQLAEKRYPQILDRAAYSRALRRLAEGISWTFDPAWYREHANIRSLARSGQEPAIAVALHYLRSGYEQALAPHWIIDTEYVATQLPVADGELVPLVLRFVEALMQGQVISPCWLVDLKFLTMLEPGLTALEHYRKLNDVAFRSDKATALLFDPIYYKSQLGRDIPDPIRHYITTGVLELITPHPAFRVDWYAAQLGLKKGTDPIRHYLIEKGCREHSPNPVLDLVHYLERYPDLDPSHVPPLCHFLKALDRIGTIPGFDRELYLQENPDIEGASLCPELHFLEYGFRESHRTPFRGFSSACIRARHRAPDPFHSTEAGTYYAQKDFRRDTVLVVSHSASRTGAPLIALRIVQELARIDSLEVLVVVFGDGPLVAEFEGSAHVIRTKNVYGADQDENAEIIESFSGRRPVITFCNSSESRHFSRSLHAADLPVISLIHEIADHYDSAAEWANIFELSERVVFPSEFVRQRSDVKLSGYLTDADAEATVLPQGLLIHNFAKFGRASSRIQTRAKHGIKEEDILVLGCGTIDLRKGIDLFLQCACRIVSDAEHKNIHFLWLGGKQAASDNENPVYWALKNLDNDQRSRINFLGSTNNVEPLFQSADLFLLSSRSDPYPCVMHEALAAQLPIVYMRDSGGSAELVGDKFGVGVPYEDVNSMCQAVLDLSYDTEKRIKYAKAGSAHVHDNAGFTSYVNSLLGIAEQVSTKRSLHFKDQRSKPLAKLEVPPRVESKVYFLNPDWGISGINSLTETLVGQLNNRGMEACVLFTRGRQTELGADGNFLPNVPIKFLDVDTQTVFPDNVHKAILKYFKRHDPCVLVTNYDYTASSLSADLPAHVGVVGVVQSDDSEHYEHTNRLGHYWNRIISVSSTISERVIKMNPSFASKLVCVPNGVTPAMEIKQLQDDARDNRPSVRIIYTGRIVGPQKRVERYAELVRLLEANGVDYQFDFVGDGEARFSLESTLGPQVKAGRVCFHGRCSPSKTEYLLSKADVFALFSDFEGMPLSLLEAVGAGCIPVVFAMDSGLNAFIDNGVSGYICHSRTVAEAAGIIEKLQAGSERRSMRIAARKLLDVNSLTADAAAIGYLEVFNDVLTECENESVVRPSWIHTSNIAGTLSDS